MRVLSIFKSYSDFFFKHFFFLLSDPNSILIQAYSAILNPSNSSKVLKNLKHLCQSVEVSVIIEALKSLIKTIQKLSRDLEHFLLFPFQNSRITATFSSWIVLTNFKNYLSLYQFMKLGFSVLAKTTFTSSFSQIFPFAPL